MLILTAIKKIKFVSIRAFLIVIFLFIFCYLKPIHVSASVTVNASYSSTHHITAPQLSTTVVTPSTIEDLTISTAPSNTIVSGVVSGTTSVKDVVYNSLNSGSVIYSCIVSAISNIGGIPLFSEFTPSIGSINSSGLATYISDGEGSYGATIGRRTRAATCPMLFTHDEYSTTYKEYLSTSTAGTIVTETKALINGLTPSASTTEIYSSKNDTTHTYVRNASLFTNSIDLTFIPAWGAFDAPIFAGALIAPDILVQANHVHATSGTVYFVTSTSTTISRTIVGGQRIGNTDIWISRLNSPILPGSGVTPAKVLARDAVGTINPSREGTKISNTAISKGDIPSVFTNGDRTLKIGRVLGFYSTLVTLLTPTKDCDVGLDGNSYNPAVPDPTYGVWYRAPHSGDSGLPAFVVINGQPVILGLWYTACNPTNLSNNFDEINTAITALGSSYSLTPVDLSGFSTF